MMPGNAKSRWSDRRDEQWSLEICLKRPIRKITLHWQTGRPMFKTPGSHHRRCLKGWCANAMPAEQWYWQKVLLAISIFARNAATISVYRQDAASRCWQTRKVSRNGIQALHPEIRCITKAMKIKLKLFVRRQALMKRWLQVLQGLAVMKWYWLCATVILWWPAWAKLLVKSWHEPLRKPQSERYRWSLLPAPAEPECRKASILWCRWRKHLPP